MWASIITMLATLLTRWLKPDDRAERIESDVQKANKVEVDINRKPDGDAQRVLKSKWRRE